MHKPPPLLIGATLVFWGWQTGFLLPGLLMAVVLESPRWVHARWDISNEDFRRIWTFCTLLLLASVVYAFTLNEGPSDFRGFFENPNPLTTREAGTASARTAAAMIRWLPMVFFPFVAAQNYSMREAIPFETISLILRIRWRRAREAGEPEPPSLNVDVSYAYFVVCLFAASIHTSETHAFFWGLCVLMAWALWSQRSRRFAVWTWLAAMAMVVTLGYFGHLGFSALRSYLEGVNPQWFSRYAQSGFDAARSRTAIGRVGRLKLSGKIVIRVQTPQGVQPPALLREASYRTYKQEVWSSETGPRAFDPVQPEIPNGNSYLLVPGKIALGQVQISSYLAGGYGLLPLPGGCSRVDQLFAFEVQKNVLGAVLVHGPGLVVFDAQYGPGAMMDGPPNPEGDDLAVPPREAAAVAQAAASLGVTAGTREEAQRKISEWFGKEFSYRTWQKSTPPVGTNDTPLGRFLLRDHKGHCEYFATATVLLLRQLGIPARYAVGYAVHEKSAANRFVVRQRDAHAWCLVWNKDRRAWQDFDTTPAIWAEVEKQGASPLQVLSDAWSRVVFEFSKIRWGQTKLRQYILWGLMPVLAVLLYQIIFRRRRRVRRGAVPEGIAWPGLDSEFYQLERRLRERGVPRLPSEPLSAWLRRAAGQPDLSDLQASLHDLLQLHYRYRFDPRGLAPAERDELRRETHACLEKMETATRH